MASHSHASARLSPRVRTWLKAFLIVLTSIGLVAGPQAVTAAVAAPAPKLSVAVASLGDTVDTGARFSYSIRVECSNLVPGDCVEPVITLPVPQSADGTLKARTPLVEQQWVKSSALNAAEDAYVITLEDMKPGDSRLLTQSWLIDNYTTPNGVELDMADPSATFTDEDGVAQVGDIAGGPEAVTTHAERIVTVNKTMVNPAYAANVEAGDEVTYRVNAYIPADTNGTIGIRKVVMVDTFDPEAEVVDGAGGNVVGNTITWEIDIDPAQQPLGAANTVVARDVVLRYPASMKPAIDSGLTREVVNLLDATVTFIDDEETTGQGQQEHSFISGTTAPSGSLHTAPRIKSMNDPENGFDTPVLNNDATTEWSYTLDGYWRDNGAEGVTQNPELSRNLVVSHRMACWDQTANDGSGQWLAPQIGQNNGLSGIFVNMVRPGAFADKGDLAAWLAQPAVEQCENPGFRLDRIEVDDVVGTGWSEGVNRGEKIAAINIAYWDAATNSGSTRQLLTPGGLHDSIVEVYGAAGPRNLGLTATQTVTDITVYYEKLVNREGSGYSYDDSDFTNKVKLWGTSSQAFVDTDATSQTLRANSAVSSRYGADGELLSDNIVYQTALQNGETLMRFNRFFTDLEVSKNALSDTSAVKPGDTLRWELKAGLGDANGTQLVTPKVVDVLPVGLEYVPGSTAIDHPSTSAPVSVEPALGTTEINGVEHQTLTWEFDEQFQPGDTATISFDTTVTLAASAGGHSGDESQQVYVFDTDGPLALLGSNPATDVHDLDGDNDKTEHVGKAARDWTVITTSGATIEKFVRGSQGADLGVGNDISIGGDEWSTAGVSAATIDHSGTGVDYRLDVTNNGTRELVGTVVYDVLPHVGDTAVGADLQGEARESDFDVTFRQLLGDLPDGVSVAFSTSENPPRPELFEGTGVTQAGATGEWTDTLPADPTTVRALRYTIGSLVPGASLSLEYRADIPLYRFGAEHPAQATDLTAEASDRIAEYAWNNLAFRTNNSDGPLLAAEAPKVSVRAILGEIGDYAWFDANNNGAQDAGETPAPGVVFQLVDIDGNDVLDTDGDPVQATTGPDGRYSFEVPIGTWSVKVVEIPEDYALAKSNLGEDDKDSDAAALNTATAPVTITKDHLVDHTLDAGLVGIVSVGDYVWHDRDEDGVQDDDEQGIGGVELSLTGPDGQPVIDVNGNLVAPVRTEADGSYSFDDLPALGDGQSYTVTVTDPPAGYAPTTAGAGARHEDSSTGYAATDHELIDLREPGARDDTLDFGFVGTVSVGDFVWKDTDKDGIQDADEPGIPNVTLTLAGPDGEPVTDTFGNLVPPTTTDENGHYSFENLPVLEDGESYTVRITTPPGLAPTVPNATARDKDSSTGEVSSEGLTEPGDSDPTLDFGLIDAEPVIEIVKTDDDGNDANTPEEAVTLPSGGTGLVFTISNNGNEDLVDIVVSDTVTAGTGAVDNIVCVFPDGAIGTSWAGPFLIDDSFECTADLSGIAPDTTHTDVASVTGIGRWSGIPTDDDDPYEADSPARVSVGDYVWFDVDEDGIQDEGEPGLSDVILTLVGPDGGPVRDVHGHEVRPTRTDANGAYSFDELPLLQGGQSYTVRVTNPEGYSPTLSGQGGDRAKDSSTGEAASQGLTRNAESDPTLDFGFITSEPGIDIEKGDGNGNDADTRDEAVALPTGETKLEFRIVNTGNEELVDITVADAVTAGTGSVDNLVCVFPDGSEGTSWAGPFLIGASFDCTAELTGIEPGTSHTDVATVTGTTRWSGVLVDDDDPYEGGNPGRVSVGDYVWQDTDNDGVQDGGEPGIENVTLTIVGPDGKPVTDVYGNRVGPVVTDENGAYSFDELPLLEDGQSYTVRVVDPAGFVPAKPGAGRDRSADSSTGEESSTGLTVHGERDSTLDFGFVPAVSVGDYVWYDLDGDGVQESGEPGIPGVTLTLVGPDGTPVTDVHGSTVAPVKTDANGRYSFNDLPVLAKGESYTVRITAPEGYRPTIPGAGNRATDSSTGEAASGDLTRPGDRDDTLDFGFIGTVSVGDYVWQDSDRDGIQDGNEPGIAGVELSIVGPDGGPVTDVNGTQVGPVKTDKDGRYSFDDLPVLAEGQSYTVRVTGAPEGYQPTKPGQGGNRAHDSATGADSSQGLTVPGQRDETLDFGFIPTVSVGDYVWHDVDRDGVQDEGEPGIPGIELIIVGPDGTPVKDIYGNEVPPVTTDENGYYSFENLPTLPAGESYTVRVSSTPEGFVPTVPGAGKDRGVDSSTGEASSGDLTGPGDRDSTLDFGFVPVVTVGDFVWSDLDGDGVQDEGEPGIPGVVLVILGPDGTPAVDVWGNPVPPAVTDKDGKYTFTDLPVLPEGESYIVRIDREATLESNPSFGAFLPTVSNAASRDADSDEWQASSQGLNLPGDADMTLDFGFVATAPVIDVEKVDAAGNDADSEEESVSLPDGETGLAFIVTNLGNEDLVNITVADVVREGTGSVSELVCVFPDGSAGTGWAGPLAPGASFECTAELTGVAPGTTHLDRVTVTGAGRWSGTPVTDDDDYHAHAPKPSIQIEKADADGNDADTVADTVRISGSTQELVFTITNVGDEALRDIVVSDVVTDGTATVDALVCAFPDGSAGVTWAGPLAVGESFECTATVTGLVENDQHTDIAAVTGIGVESGKSVSDEDPYNVIRVPLLATTGGQVSVMLVTIALLLATAGGLLLAMRRRRSAA